jgi:hypothetical protein
MRRGERKGSGDAARESGAKWGWGQEKEEEEEEELDRMNGGRILLVPKPQFAPPEAPSLLCLFSKSDQAVMLQRHIASRCS